MFGRTGRWIACVGVFDRPLCSAGEASNHLVLLHKIASDPFEQVDVRAPRTVQIVDAVRQGGGRLPEDHCFGLTPSSGRNTDSQPHSEASSL